MFVHMYLLNISFISLKPLCSSVCARLFGTTGGPECCHLKKKKTQVPCTLRHGVLTQSQIQSCAKLSSDKLLLRLLQEKASQAPRRLLLQAISIMFYERNLSIATAFFFLLRRISVLFSHCCFCYIFSTSSANMPLLQ